MFPSRLYCAGLLCSSSLVPAERWLHAGTEPEAAVNISWSEWATRRLVESVMMTRGSLVKKSGENAGVAQESRDGLEKWNYRITSCLSDAPATIRGTR